MENRNDNILTQALLVMSNTVEAKDRYTNGHSRRVADYARQIAGHYGYSEEDQQKVYFAGLLHDIGKIRVPDTIINKAGRLTDEEFSYMKLHTIAGYHILRPLSEMSYCADAAKWHHERYDGRGYPGGIKGENIPEIARIICVADSYDAMTSNRSYRSVLPQAKVREEIEKNKGTQFDPIFADIMLSMIDADTGYDMRQKAGGQKQILIVDDDPLILREVRKILNQEDKYQVYLAKGGKMGVEEALSRDLDLILLDLMMPELDGFQALHVIRSFGIHVPVIFLTGEKDIETMNKASESQGVADYILKPVRPDLLRETVETVLSAARKPGS